MRQSVLAPHTAMHEVTISMTQHLGIGTLRGGLRATVFTVVLATGWCGAVSTPASAADFGGDCCADLEERIAELEATTARKGNRKVSLTISGQVSQALLAWDDGQDSDVYVVSNSNSGNRLRFEGDARISRDLSAGYYLDWSMNPAPASAVHQLDNTVRLGEPTVRHSIWYLSSKSLGAVSVGLGGPATDGIIGFNLGRTSIAADSDGGGFGTGLFTRDSSIAGLGSLNNQSSGSTISLRWRRFLEDLDSKRGNMVRYDTPIIRGFTASASWGDDDFWDVAIRHAHKNKYFQWAAGVGFYQQLDVQGDVFGWPRGNRADNSTGDKTVSEWKGSASILHEDTGLFASANYVHREFDGTDLGVRTFACFDTTDAQSLRAAGVACTNRPDFDYFWVSGGIRRNFTGLGWTSIYGEYARSEDAVTGLNVNVQSAGGGDIDIVTSSTMHIWGAGIVQNIRAAGMDLYISYRHFEADVSGLEANGTRVDAPIDDADVLLFGSRIRF